MYGEPRETKDADLAVLAADAALAARALERAGIDASVAFERVRFGGNLISRLTLLPGTRTTGLNVLDLVEPRSPRFARDVIDRALEGELRGSSIRVVAPEDFVLLKVLSTRERDIEDAASVVRALEGRLDHALLAAEGARLAAEIGDHDVASRLARARA